MTRPLTKRPQSVAKLPPLLLLLPQKCQCDLGVYLRGVFVTDTRETDVQLRSEMDRQARHTLLEKPLAPVSLSVDRSTPFFRVRAVADRSLFFSFLTFLFACLSVVFVNLFVAPFDDILCRCLVGLVHPFGGNSIAVTRLLLNDHKEIFNEFVRFKDDVHTGPYRTSPFLVSCNSILDVCELLRLVSTLCASIGSCPSLMYFRTV